MVIGVIGVGPPYYIDIYGKEAHLDVFLRPILLFWGSKSALQDLSGSLKV